LHIPTSGQLRGFAQRQFYARAGPNAQPMPRRSNHPETAEALGHSITFVQSNIEGELVDFIQAAGRDGAGIVINPAAYTHTSVALHDALKAVDVPSVEIHLSQPARRESFRRRSYVAEAVHGTISGFGADSYILGLQALSNLLEV